MTEYLSRYSAKEGYVDHNGEAVDPSSLCIGLTPLPVITWHPSCGPSDISAHDFARASNPRVNTSSTVTNAPGSDLSPDAFARSANILENKSPVIGIRGRFMEIQTLATGSPYLCQYLDLIHLSKDRMLFISEYYPRALASPATIAHIAKSQDPRLLLHIAHDTLSALSYLHENSISHSCLSLAHIQVPPSSPLTPPSSTNFSSSYFSTSSSPSSSPTVMLHGYPVWYITQQGQHSPVEPRCPLHTAPELLLDLGNAPTPAHDLSRSSCSEVGMGSGPAGPRESALSRRIRLLREMKGDAWSTGIVLMFLARHMHAAHVCAQMEKSHASLDGARVGNGSATGGPWSASFIRQFIVQIETAYLDIINNTQTRTQTQAEARARADGALEAKDDEDGNGDSEGGIGIDGGVACAHCRAHPSLLSTLLSEPASTSILTSTSSTDIANHSCDDTGSAWMSDSLWPMPQLCARCWVDPRTLPQPRTLPASTSPYTSVAWSVLSTTLTNLLSLDPRVRHTPQQALQSLSLSFPALIPPLLPSSSTLPRAQHLSALDVVARALAQSGTSLVHMHTQMHSHALTHTHSSSGSAITGISSGNVLSGTGMGMHVDMLSRDVQSPLLHGILDAMESAADAVYHAPLHSNLSLSTTSPGASHSEFSYLASAPRIFSLLRGEHARRRRIAAVTAAQDALRVAVRSVIRRGAAGVDGEDVVEVEEVGEEGWTGEWVGTMAEAEVSAVYIGHDGGVATHFGSSASAGMTTTSKSSSASPASPPLSFLPTVYDALLPQFPVTSDADSVRVPERVLVDDVVAQLLHATASGRLPQEMLAAARAAGLSAGGGEGAGDEEKGEEGLVSMSLARYMLIEAFYTLARNTLDTCATSTGSGASSGAGSASLSASSIYAYEPSLPALTVVLIAMTAAAAAISPTVAVVPSSGIPTSISGFLTQISRKTALPPIPLASLWSHHRVSGLSTSDIASVAGIEYPPAIFTVEPMSIPPELNAEKPFAFTSASVTSRKAPPTTLLSLSSTCRLLEAETALFSLSPLFFLCIYTQPHPAPCLAPAHSHHPILRSLLHGLSPATKCLHTALLAYLLSQWSSSYHDAHTQHAQHYIRLHLCVAYTRARFPPSIAQQIIALLAVFASAPTCNVSQAAACHGINAWLPHVSTPSTPTSTSTPVNNNNSSSSGSSGGPPSHTTHTKQRSLLVSLLPLEPLPLPPQPLRAWIHEALLQTHAHTPLLISPFSSPLTALSLARSTSISAIVALPPASSPAAAIAILADTLPSLPSDVKLQLKKDLPRCFPSTSLVHSPTAVAILKFALRYVLTTPYASLDAPTATHPPTLSSPFLACAASTSSTSSSSSSSLSQEPLALPLPSPLVSSSVDCMPLLALPPRDRAILQPLLALTHMHTHAHVDPHTPHASSAPSLPTLPAYTLTSRALAQLPLALSSIAHTSFVFAVPRSGPSLSPILASSTSTSSAMPPSAPSPPSLMLSNTQNNFSILHYPPSHALPPSLPSLPPHALLLPHISAQTLTMLFPALPNTRCDPMRALTLMVIDAIGPATATSLMSSSSVSLSTSSRLFSALSQSPWLPPSALSLCCPLHSTHTHADEASTDTATNTTISTSARHAPKRGNTARNTTASDTSPASSSPVTSGDAVASQCTCSPFHRAFHRAMALYMQATRQHTLTSLFTDTPTRTHKPNHATDNTVDPRFAREAEAVSVPVEVDVDSDEKTRVHARQRLMRGLQCWASVWMEEVASAVGGSDSVSFGNSGGNGCVGGAGGNKIDRDETCTSTSTSACTSPASFSSLFSQMPCYWQGMDTVVAAATALAHAHTQAHPLPCLLPSSSSASSPAERLVYLGAASWLAHTCSLTSRLIRRYLWPLYTVDNSIAMARMLTLTSQLLCFHDPLLAIHLHRLGYTPHTYALPWYLTLFAQHVPLRSLEHVWTVLLTHPPEIVIALTLSLLITSRKMLLVEDMAGVAAVVARQLAHIDAVEWCERAVAILAMTPSALLADSPYIPDVTAIATPTTTTNNNGNANQDSTSGTTASTTLTTAVNTALPSPVTSSASTSTAASTSLAREHRPLSRSSPALEPSRHGLPLASISIDALALMLLLHNAHLHTYAHDRQISQVCGRPATHATAVSRTLARVCVGGYHRLQQTFARSIEQYLIFAAGVSADTNEEKEKERVEHDKRASTHTAPAASTVTTTSNTSTAGASRQPLEHSVPWFHAPIWVIDLTVASCLCDLAYVAASQATLAPAQAMVVISAAHLCALPPSQTDLCLPTSAGTTQSRHDGLSAAPVASNTTATTTVGAGASVGVPTASATAASTSTSTSTSTSAPTSTPPPIRDLPVELATEALAAAVARASAEGHMPWLVLVSEGKKAASGVARRMAARGIARVSTCVVGGSVHSNTAAAAVSLASSSTSTAAAATGATPTATAAESATAVDDAVSTSTTASTTSTSAVAVLDTTEQVSSTLTAPPASTSTAITAIAASEGVTASPTTAVANTASSTSVSTSTSTDIPLTSTPPPRAPPPGPVSELCARLYRIGQACDMTRARLLSVTQRAVEQWQQLRVRQDTRKHVWDEREVSVRTATLPGGVFGRQDAERGGDKQGKASSSSSLSAISSTMPSASATSTSSLRPTAAFAASELARRAHEQRAAEELQRILEDTAEGSFDANAVTRRRRAVTTMATGTEADAGVVYYNVDIKEVDRVIAEGSVLEKETKTSGKDLTNPENRVPNDTNISVGAVTSTATTVTAHPRASTSNSTPASTPATTTSAPPHPRASAAASAPHPRAAIASSAATSTGPSAQHPRATAASTTTTTTSTATDATHRITKDSTQTTPEAETKAEVEPPTRTNTQTPVKAKSAVEVPSARVEGRDGVSAGATTIMPDTSVLKSATPAPTTASSTSNPTATTIPVASASSAPPTVSASVPIAASGPVPGGASTPVSAPVEFHFDLDDMDLDALEVDEE